MLLHSIFVISFLMTRLLTVERSMLSVLALPVLSMNNLIVFVFFNNPTRPGLAVASEPTFIL